MKKFILNDKLPKYLGIVLGFLAFCIYFYLSSAAFEHGPSSVGSSLGLMFAPIESLIIGIIFFVLGLAIGFLVLVIQKKRQLLSFKGILSSFALVFFIYFALVPFYYYLTTLYTIHRVYEMNKEELIASVSEYKEISPKYRSFIYSAIIKNNQSDEKVYHQIVLLQDPILNDNMWSIAGLLGENRKGIAVYRMIARDPRTTVETLALLAKNQNDYVVDDVVLNKKTPIEILRQIHKTHPNLYWGFIFNPHTPTDIMIDIANTYPNYLKDEINYNKLINHPNLPKEYKEKLEKEKK